MTTDTPPAPTAPRHPDGRSCPSTGHARDLERRLLQTPHDQPVTGLCGCDDANLAMLPRLAEAGYERPRRKLSQMLRRLVG